MFVSKRNLVERRDEVAVKSKFAEEPEKISDRVKFI